VHASFLADVKTVKPGDVFDVGIFLQIDPDWHIYWENPGDSGSPTRATITAPPGVAVESMRYPLPEEFTQPGDIKGYGYTDEVMLIARVNVPPDWPRGKPIQLTAQVSWLNCKDVCIPGKAVLELTVETGDQNENANSSLFAKWHPRLPLRVKDRTVPLTVDGPVNDLKVRWNAPVKDVKVFPVPPEGVDVVSLDVSHADTTTTIKPVLRPLGGEKKPGAALGLLITYEAENGQRRGVRLSIPLQSGG
jgi:thiol:disulfide interchange protein DsbD